MEAHYTLARMMDTASLSAGTAEVLRLFLDVIEGVERRPVSPRVGRDDLAKRFRGTLSDVGVGLERALRDVGEHVIPFSMGIGHPCYMGLVNSSTLPAAALGDLLVSALNNNAGAAHQSHALLAAEEEVVRAFSTRLGLPPCGMTLPGGTFANLQGLVLARTAAFDDGAPAEARLYTSTATHFSVARAARVAGLRRAQIRALPARGRGTLDPDGLRDAIAADRRAGLRPFAVVGTLGTTGTGAVDPLPEIAAICAEESLWFHVDACYGGASLLLESPPCGALGVSRADSVAIDPHKWFFMPIVAALLLHRHPDVAARAFADDASYIPVAREAEPWQLGIPTSRRAAGFPIWMSLRTHGFGAIREIVERNIVLTRQLEHRFEEAGARVLNGGELSVACVRLEPRGLTPADTDRLQQEVAARVCATGRAWFSTVQHDGLCWMRFNILNFRTRGEHVDAVVELVLQAAAELGAPPARRVDGAALGAS
jgi:aromatic-L-amino-acid/L-tryptophan decarboxylase